MTQLGRWLIKNTIVRKASSENLRGMEVWERSERPTSTIWWCLCLADPFCWWACGQDTWWCNSKALEKGIQALLFPSPISLHSHNLPIKQAFNKVLEVMKTLEHFRFVLKKRNPCKLAKIIDKANITIVSSNRGRSQTPYIRKYKIQRIIRHTKEFGIGQQWLFPCWHASQMVSLFDSG
jgi:hypothetical protein